MKRSVFSLLLAFSILVPSSGFADDAVQPVITPIKGPNTVELGNNFAKLTIPKGYSYLSKEDTNALNKFYGDPVENNSIGSFLPSDENQSWFIALNYEESGYVPDEDSSKLDADAILKDYIKGTEEQNKELKKNNMDLLTVTGWHTPPAYDKKTHILTWTLSGESNSNKFVNDETRLLTRKGYISATLITDTSTIDVDKSQIGVLLKNLTIDANQVYEKYDKSTDKKSEFGLLGLMSVGGAGVVLAKSGALAAIFIILKKFIILIIVAIVGFFAWLRKKR